ncbi:MAG: hypothetical protein HYV01_06560, partial [Deltaproteobacteria bacterium]|nr:hypothetical protein [Deltaproteobacteria bacterium]
EKADCGCSKNNLGEPPTSYTSDTFTQARCEGQEKNSESGNQSEVVRQIEGFLGGEKSKQEVILDSY